MSKTIRLLDHGIVRLVETWGAGDAGEAEAGIIEAARQSTQGTFRGWEPGVLEDGTEHPGDARLLRYMYRNQHSTPFEFAGMGLEVRAPIFVFRQWHRHRLFSVNEASGRYGPLPDLWYVPTLDRVMAGALPTDNRQAGGTGGLTETEARAFIQHLEVQARAFATCYTRALDAGVPNELARLGMPVNWYSQMRVSCTLRGWLHFLGLRLDPHAQWEIRQYAEAVFELVKQEFPRTAELFEEGR